MAKNYDESTVKTLDALEHIRLRTGMYIGRLGDGSHHDDGIYIMIKEIIDNSIDEFIMKNGKKVIVTLDPETRMVKVRDFGRGIPLGKVIDCVSQINTGAKYNDDVFQFSVGLNGVGTKAVNALSDIFSCEATATGNLSKPHFQKENFSVKKREKPTNLTAPTSNLSPIPKFSKNTATKTNLFLKDCGIMPILTRV